VKQQLIKVKEKLANGWTSGAMARDASGKEVSSMAPEAVSWCLVGAMCRVFTEEGVFSKEYYKARELIVERMRQRIGLRGNNLMLFNDKYGKEAVLSVLDEVIK
jgi:hypothetical protein